MNSHITIILICSHPKCEKMPWKNSVEITILSSAAPLAWNIYVVVYHLSVGCRGITFAKDVYLLRNAFMCTMEFGKHSTRTLFRFSYFCFSFHFDTII